MNRSKRPTANKPFNPSTTHPASIPSMSGGSSKTQKREHVTKSTGGGEGKEGGNSTEAEIGQSGGGGGGGTGAGSLTGAGNEGDIDSLTSSSGGGGGKGKGIDSSKVHPASIGGGGNGEKGKRDSKL